MSKRTWIATGALGAVVLGAGISSALADDRTDKPLDTLVVGADQVAPAGALAIDVKPALTRTGLLIDRSVLDPATIAAPSAATPLVVISAPEPAPIVQPAPAPAPAPAPQPAPPPVYDDSGASAYSAYSVDSAD